MPDNRAGWLSIYILSDEYDAQLWTLVIHEGGITSKQSFVILPVTPFFHFSIFACSRNPYFANAEHASDLV